MENQQNKNNSTENLEIKLQLIKASFIKRKLIGALLILVGLVGVIYFYDWKLAICVFLCMWGSNIEQSAKITEKLAEIIIRENIKKQH